MTCGSGKCLIWSDKLWDWKTQVPLQAHFNVAKAAIILLRGSWVVGGAFQFLLGFPMASVSWRQERQVQQSGKAQRIFTQKVASTGLIPCHVLTNTWQESVQVSPQKAEWGLWSPSEVLGGLQPFMSSSLLRRSLAIISFGRERNWTVNSYLFIFFDVCM